MSDDDLTDDELLNLPGDEIPSGRLAEFFSRRAGIVQQRQLGERIAELSGNSLHHFLLSPDRDPREKHRREEAERRWLAEMRDIRDREDRLLARIDEQQRIVEKRWQEIQDNALHLHDGRRAYVDGNGYRDEQGRALNGADYDEANRLHEQNPNASTWDQRQKIQDQLDEAERLRQRVLKEQQEAQRDGQGVSADELERRRKDAEQRMTGYEQEFHDRIESTQAALAAKPDIASAYDAVMLDDYAGPAGGEGKTAAPDFTRAVAGPAEMGPAQRSVQPSGQGAPKIQT
jgi:hypothetical protein